MVKIHNFRLHENSGNISNNNNIPCLKEDSGAVIISSNYKAYVSMYTRFICYIYLHSKNPRDYLIDSNKNNPSLLEYQSIP